MSNSAFTPTFAQNLQDASATQKGLVNTTTQVFAGKKTFDGGVAIKGDTSGNAIASGYVGEVVPGTLAADSSFTSETLTDLASTSLPLTAGIWEVTLIVPCLLSLSALTGGTRISQVLQITRSDNTVIAATGVNAVETGQSPLRRITEVTLTGTIRLTGNDTLKLRGRLGKWSGTESYTASESIIYTGFGYQFYAKRIG